MKLKYYWKSLLMTCVILYLSFARISPIEHVPQFRFTDKLAHFVLYLFYALILMFDLKKTREKVSGLAFVLICLLWPVLLGGINEILQSRFFPPRQGDWFDFLSNITGVLVAWGLFALFWKRDIKT